MCGSVKVIGASRQYRRRIETGTDELRKHELELLADLNVGCNALVCRFPDDSLQGVVQDDKRAIFTFGLPRFSISAGSSCLKCTSTSGSARMLFT